MSVDDDVDSRNPHMMGNEVASSNGMEILLKPLLGEKADAERITSYVRATNFVPRDDVSERESISHG